MKLRNYIITILVIIVLLWFITCVVYKRAKGPPRDYWFWRSDGTGKQEYRPSRGVYLKQSITSPASLGKCSADQPCKFPGLCRDGECCDHVNSEIYNNPCCKSQVDCNKLSLVNIPDSEYISGSFNKGVCEVFKGLCSVNGDVGGNFSTWNSMEDKGFFDKFFSFSKDSTFPDKCHLIPTTVPVDTPWDVSQFIRDLYLNNPYLYNTVKITIKMNNVKGPGSRGWGFWTTYYPWQFIWFMNSNGKDKAGNDYKMNGFYAMILTIKDGKPYSSGIKLPDLDEEYRDYRIEWRKNEIGFYIDDTKVFTENRELYIPDVNLSFHCWIDNFIYDFDDKGNVSMLPHFFDGEQSQEVKSLEFM
jgi:hypothetical protein